MGPGDCAILPLVLLSSDGFVLDNRTWEGAGTWSVFCFFLACSMVWRVVEGEE